MMRTMTNVAGQALVPTIVAKREGILDETAYHGDRAADPVAGPVDEPVGTGVLVGAH